MKTDSQQLKEREADLNAAIKALDLAKTSSILPAKAVFGSVIILLTTIRVRFLFLRNGLLQFTPSQDSMINEPDYVELGLSCADVCRTLGRGTNGKRQDELSLSVYDAMSKLTL